MYFHIIDFRAVCRYSVTLRNVGRVVLKNGINYIFLLVTMLIMLSFIVIISYCN